jgi:hypothetical protein
MLKHIMDISNLKNTRLYIAILDVEAAYDSVPLEAVYAGFRKIRALEHLIEILKRRTD